MACLLKNSLYLFLMTALLSVNMMNAAVAEKPRPFSAKYTIKYSVASADMEVQYRKGEGINEFIYSTDTKAKGIARIVLSEPISQSSRFLVEKSGLKPLGFVSKDGARKGKNNVQLSFDWEAHQASYKDNKGAKAVKLTNGIQDLLSVQIAVMKDLATGKTPLKYSVIEKGGRVRAYEYHKIKEETLNIVGRSYKTIRYDLKREKSIRVVVYWFVPELDYLPVRIRQLKMVKNAKKMRTVFTAVLTSVKGF